MLIESSLITSYISPQHALQEQPQFQLSKSLLKWLVVTQETRFSSWERINLSGVHKKTLDLE